MPMFMGLLGLMKARAFLRFLPVPGPQETRGPQHTPYARGACGHDIRVQHHQGQAAATLLGVIVVETDEACFSQSKSQKSRGIHPLCSFTLP